MPDLGVLLAFAITAVALVVLPGPNLILIVTQAVTNGTRAGLVSAAGVETATLLYVTATAAGVAGLLSSSPVAFTAVKSVGVAYLIYLAIQSLRHPSRLALSGSDAGPHLGRVYRDGVVVNLLNPKVALFFLALFPQFVDTTSGAASAQLQMVILGGIFMLIALLLDIVFAVACGAVARVFRRRGEHMTWTGWPVAAVYAGLAGYACIA